MSDTELIEPEDEQENDLYEHFRLVVDKGQTLIRIDKFLTSRIENATRNKIQNAAEAGSILVNDKPVKSNYRVKPLDVISIVLTHPPRNKEIIPQDLPLNVVFEDDDLIIINKEPGMVVHPGHGNYSGTLVNALMYRFNYLPSMPQKTKEEEIVRPGLVHRIDKNTSGIMVLAKNEIALSKLAKQFFDRTTDRKYIALVWGVIKEDAGTITGNIGRHLKDRLLMDVFPNGDHGKHAVTHYKVIERFAYATLVECKLETGRTHQIRVHMQFLGHPLFNDERYGGNKVVKGVNNGKYKQFIDNCFELMPRHGLHAKSLALTHPVSKERMFFDSELPQDMVAVIEKWRNFTQSVV